MPPRPFTVRGTRTAGSAPIAQPDGTIQWDTVTAGVADGAVTTAKIVDGAVTSAKIADGTIATADLADGAITSAKIADATIATADLADGAVTSAKIADGTIVAADIASGTITDAQVAAANKDGADATASMRTLGSASGKAAHGWAEKGLRSPRPHINKLIAWTMDRVIPQNASGALTAGKVYGALVPLPIDTAFTFVDLEITNTPGSSSNCYAGVYTLSGTTLTRVAVSSDQAAAWASSGAKAPAVSTGTLTGGETTYVGICFLFGATTTAPQVLVAGTNTTRPNGNLTAGVDALRFFSILTGQTALPSSIDLLSAAMAQSFYLAAG